MNTFHRKGVFQLGFRKCLRTACSFPEWPVTHSFSEGSAFLTSQMSPRETMAVYDAFPCRLNSQSCNICHISFKCLASEQPPLELVALPPLFQSL